MNYKDVIKDTTWIKDIKCGVVNENGLANYLMRSVPATVLAQCLASYIFDDISGKRNEKIVISEDVLRRHFRIQGFKDEEYRIEGEKENRGGNNTQK